MALLVDLARYVMQGWTLSTLLLSLAVFMSTYFAKAHNLEAALGMPDFMATWLAGMVTMAHEVKCFGTRVFMHRSYEAAFIGMPFWFRRCYPWLFGLVMILFVLSIVQDSRTSPRFQSRGEILAVRDQDVVEDGRATEPKQLPRLFATFTVFGSFSAFTYWWFGAGSGRPATLWEQPSREI